LLLLCGSIAHSLSSDDVQRRGRGRGSQGSIEVEQARRPEEFNSAIGSALKLINLLGFSAVSVRSPTTMASFFLFHLLHAWIPGWLQAPSIHDGIGNKLPRVTASIFNFLLL
jgi:hypothetical protein